MNTCGPLKSSSYGSQLGKAISEGFEDYFRCSKKSTIPSMSCHAWVVQVGLYIFWELPHQDPNSSSVSGLHNMKCDQSKIQHSRSQEQASVNTLIFHKLRQPGHNNLLGPERWHQCQYQFFRHRWTMLSPSASIKSTLPRIKFKFRKAVAWSIWKSGALTVVQSELYWSSYYRASTKDEQ